MSNKRLTGVIAAVATPYTPDLQPDLGPYLDFCEWLLANGCDGLNLCGTTGEATSMSVSQRMTLMTAAAARLPLERLMVGTGAASVHDAVALTRHAGELGFGAALLLPSFYYPAPTDEGVVRYFESIASATQASDIPIYLYNIPANTGVEFSMPLIGKLRQSLGTRLRGLKDSSGNMDYSRQAAALGGGFDVFPSNEAVLLDARGGAFAGCISASANVNSQFCGAAWKDGDAAASQIANRIRAAVSKRNLVASVKAVVADMRGDAAFDRLLAPLVALAPAEKEALLAEVNKAREDAPAVH